MISVATQYLVCFYLFVLLIVSVKKNTHSSMALLSVHTMYMGVNFCCLTDRTTPMLPELIPIVFNIKSPGDANFSSESSYTP